MGDAAEGHDDHGGGRRQKLGFEKRPAGVDLSPDRLVGRRHATHRIGDAAVDRREAVVRLGAEMSFGEAVADERGVEQIARIIAGERPSGAIRPAQSGRETDDQKPRVFRAKGGDGCVVPVGAGALVVAAEGDQARAKGAGRRG